MLLTPSSATPQSRWSCFDLWLADHTMYCMHWPVTNTSPARGCLCGDISFWEGSTLGLVYGRVYFPLPGMTPGECMGCVDGAIRLPFSGDCCRRVSSQGHGLMSRRRLVRPRSSQRRVAAPGADATSTIPRFQTSIRSRTGPSSGRPPCPASRNGGGRRSQPAIWHHTPPLLRYGKAREWTLQDSSPGTPSPWAGLDSALLVPVRRNSRSRLPMRRKYSSTWPAFVGGWLPATQMPPSSSLEPCRTTVSYLHR